MSLGYRRGIDFSSFSAITSSDDCILPRILNKSSSFSVSSCFFLIQDLERIRIFTIFVRSESIITEKMDKKATPKKYVEKKLRPLNQRVKLIYDALTRMGGCAPLKALYQYIGETGWGTKTPRATIRQKLQQNPHLFVNLNRGVWATTAYVNAQRQITLQTSTQSSPSSVINIHNNYGPIDNSSLHIQQAQDVITERGIKNVNTNMKVE